MARNSVYTNVTARTSLSPATRSTNATVNGTGVDRNENADMHRTAMVLVHTGTITDGTHTVEVQDSDDDATYTAVTDQFLQGTEPAIGTSDDDSMFHIGYIGVRRFVRVSVTTAGATSGGTFGAVVVLGEPRRGPTDHTGA